MSSDSAADAAMSSDSAAEPDSSVSASTRVIVEGNTVKTSDGELLRGSTFWMLCDHTSHFEFGDKYQNWQLVKNSHFNAVRLALKFESCGWDLKSYLADVRKWVDWGKQLGLYVMLDHHEVGTHNQQWLVDFWTAASKEFKDDENVIFEIANEPVGWEPWSYTEQDNKDFIEIYKIMRSNAPETHVVFLSFAKVISTGKNATKATAVEVVDALNQLAQADSELPNGIDWSNASVGFHPYWITTSAPVMAIKAKYPVLATEVMNYRFLDNGKVDAFEFKVDGEEYQTKVWEAKQVSWFTWDTTNIEGNLTKRLDPMLAHAKANNYQWW